MKKLRNVLVVLVVLSAVGAAWLGIRTATQEDRVEFHWRQVAAAREAGDLEGARRQLGKLLERWPDQGEAHWAMADVCREQEKQAGRPDTYASSAEAMEHLFEAARLMPDDLEMQKAVVAACLACRPHPLQQSHAAAVRIARAEPDNVDAMFVLAAQGVETKYLDQADHFLDKLRGVPSRRVFETMALEWRNAADRPERMKGVFEEVMRLTRGMDRKQLEAMGPAEVESMTRLLFQAATGATGPDEALARAEYAVDLYQQAVEIRPQMLRPLAERTARMLSTLVERGRLAATPVTVEPAGGTLAVGKVPPQLLAKAERLRAAAMAAGDALPIVYLQSAAAAFYRQDTAAGLAMVGRGIAAVQKLPPRWQKEANAFHLLACQWLCAAGRYAEAEEQARAISGSRVSDGWGDLAASRAAMDEGKFAKAKYRALLAQSALGNVPARHAVGRAMIALEEWKEAKEHLPGLHVPAEQLARFPVGLAGLADGFDAGVHLDQLRVCLGLNQWKEAQPHRAAVKGTALEATGEALAIGWMTKNHQEAEAAKLLADARRRFPANMELLQLALAAAEQSGRREEARGMIEQFAAATPNDLRSQLVLWSWRAAHQELGAPQQLDELEKRLAKSPADRQAIARVRALSLLATGQAAQAAELWASLGSTAPDAPVKLAIGAWELAQGDCAHSLHHLAEILEVTAVRSQAGPAVVQSAATLAKQKSPAEVEEKIKALLRWNPDEPFLLVAQAHVAFQQNRFNAAMEILDAVKRVDPNNLLGRTLEAEQWLLADNPQRAINAAERALEIAPADVLALVVAAQASLPTKEYLRALNFADRALQRAPNLAAAMLAKAQALEALGRIDPAIAVLEGAINASPERIDAHRRLVAVYAAAGQPDKALQACRAACKRLPADTSLLLDHVRLLATAGRVAEAEAAAAAFAGGKPPAAVQLSVAHVFLAGGQLEAAQTWARRVEALGAQPEKAAVQSLLGEIALRQHARHPDPQRLAEARDHFAAAVAVQPKNMAAAAHLAKLLATEFKQPQQAVQVMEQALDRPITPHTPDDAIHAQAMAYRLAKRPADARRIVERALELKPDRPALLLELGADLVELNRPAEATTVIRKAILVGLADEQLADARRVAEAAEQKATQIREAAERQEAALRQAAAERQAAADRKAAERRAATDRRIAAEQKARAERQAAAQAAAQAKGAAKSRAGIAPRVPEDPTQPSGR